MKLSIEELDYESSCGPSYAPEGSLPALSSHSVRKTYTPRLRLAQSGLRPA
jgi:hypothetical protein